MRPVVQLLSHFLLFIALMLSLHSRLGAQTPSGKVFLVTLPAVIAESEKSDTSFKFIVEILSSRRTKVSVQWANSGSYLIQDAILQQGEKITVMRPMFELMQILQPLNNLPPDQPNMRAFLVTADEPVSVYVRLDKNNRTECYSAVPISAYDTSYTVMTLLGNSITSMRGGFLITSAEDGTQVTITPSERTWAFFIHDSGVAYTMSMQKNQVYQVLSQNASTIKSDLVGTTIVSNKPIGVLGFSVSSVPPYPLQPPGTTVPPDDVPWRAKTMMEPQLPDSKAGTVFYATPFARQDSTVVRFVATQNGTKFMVDGIKILKPDKQDSIFNRGMEFDYWTNHPTKIEASKPVIGAQFAYSSDHTSYDSTVHRPNQPDIKVKIPYGDPMMVALRPIDQYGRTVQWITPLLDPRPPLSGSSPIAMFWEDYVMITAPVEARGTVFLDGKLVDLPINYQDGLYVSGIVRVLPTRHLIESDYPISAVAYGFTWNDSYGMNASEALRSFGAVNIDTLRFTTCSSSLDTAFIVSNLGNNIFRIDSAVFSGVQGKVLVPATFPQAYNPGANNNFAIALTLPQPGTFFGILRLYSDANNRSVFEIPIIATRDSAQLQIPTTIDFGVIGAGETQHDTTIAVRNNGPRPLILTAANFTGTGFSVLSPTLPDTIPPNTTHSLQIRFVPINGLAREATMKITGAPCLTLDVKLRGFQGGGASLLVQNKVDYPSFLCTAPAFVDSTIAIRSIGDEPVTILTAAINGKNPGDFTLRDDPVAKSPILPGDTMFIRVRFTPGGPGPRSAKLDMTTTAVNAPNVSIDLQGRKDTAFVLPSVTTIDFGTLKSCDPARDTTITLQNNGSWPDTIRAIDIGGSANYIIGSTLPLIIYPGSTQELKITFAPTIDGTFPVTLDATDGPCGGGMKLQLTGERIAPSLLANIQELRFDTLYTCELRAITRKIMLRNDGRLADTISRASFAGSSGFTTTRSFPIVLLPGAVDSIDVTFTPGGAGNSIGALALDWGPCESRKQIDLFGIVLDPQTTLSAQGMDFGSVDIGLSGKRTITIGNTGTAPRIVEGVDLGTTGGVRVTQPTSFPVTLAPGEELTIEIEYTPAAAHETLDATATLTISSPCPQQQSFTLKGEGIGEEVIRGSLTLGVPTKTSGMIDDTVKIPISITASSNLAALAPTTIHLVLRHDYTMLTPTNITTTIPGMIAKITRNQITGNDREIEIELSGGTFPSEGEIAQLESFVLIGDAMTTPLVIDSVALTLPQNRVATVSTVGGTFDVLGVCITGGNRLVRLNSSLALKTNHPNPFRSGTTIDFETSEGGPAEMVVLDANGRLVATLFDKEIAAGSYSIYFDGSTLPSGLYFCELRSRNERLRTSMLLVQ